MLNKILPKKLENKFTGHKIALYAFVIITLVTIGRSLIHILSADGGAQSIATIPLNSYSIESANAVVLLFAYWGVSQLIIGIVYLIVLFKYKELIPLMYLLLFLEYSGRLLTGLWKPIETVNTAPGAIGNYILIPLSLILFYLSLPKTSKN